MFNFVRDKRGLLVIYSCTVPSLIIIDDKAAQCSVQVANESKCSTSSGQDSKQISISNRTIKIALKINQGGCIFCTDFKDAIAENLHLKGACAIC
jgi:thioredoxin-related protein